MLRGRPTNAERMKKQAELNKNIKKLQIGKKNKRQRIVGKDKRKEKWKRGDS